MVKACALITKAWLQLRSNNPLYNDQWISDETWLRLIKKHYSALQDAINFNRAALNRALSPLVGEFNSSNIPGIYRTQFFTLRLYDDKKKRQVSFYYRQVHNEPPSRPTAATDVLYIHAKSIRIHNYRLRLAPSEKDKLENNVAKAIKNMQRPADKRNHRNNKISNKRRNKRRWGGLGGVMLK